MLIGHAKPNFEFLFTARSLSMYFTPFSFKIFHIGSLNFHKGKECFSVTSLVHFYKWKNK